MTMYSANEKNATIKDNTYKSCQTSPMSDELMVMIKIVTIGWGVKKLIISIIMTPKGERIWQRQTIWQLFPQNFPWIFWIGV